MNNESQIKELKIDELRWSCNIDEIEQSIEQEIEINEIVGQDRALKALKIGTELFADGYNIFICGMEGTGRLSTVEGILENIRPRHSLLYDRCYVHNFENPERPILITLQPGEGKLFAKEMDNFLEYCIKNLSSVFEDELYLEKHKHLNDDFTEGQKVIFEAFEEKAKKDGFALVQVANGNVLITDVYPIIADQAVAPEEIPQLISSGKIEEDNIDFEHIETGVKEYRDELEQILRKVRKKAVTLEEMIDVLDKDTAKKVIESTVEAIKEKFNNKCISTYVDSVFENILDNLHLFKEQEDKPKNHKTAKGLSKSLIYTKYRVNLILDNSKKSLFPVIVETNPTYKNLFGWIDKSYDKYGVWRTDFMQIKPGAILLADGGYLVINAIDALSEHGVWNHLKRVLKYKKLEIQNIESNYIVDSVKLKPEPINITTKIIMIGDEDSYHAMLHFDKDFKNIFKIKADFDSVMKNDPQNINKFYQIVNKIIHTDNLLPFDKSAIKAIIEHGVRVAGSKDKITTRFGIVTDLIKEANYWAVSDNCDKVTAENIEKTIDEKYFRHSLIEEHIQEMIEQDIIMIDVKGEKVGQINGLAVYEIGGYAFGKPSRITVSTSIGKTGIINIEREAKMSGKTHDKGVLILTGFLKETFSQRIPLSISISICFEQSYSGVDGDSASSTELYAILSSLSDLPIKQSIAVTGSVNQKGEIQSIGGVNYKIEGFFKVCKAYGLTGKQGVIIPQSNVMDLQLNREVVDAVKNGMFHIYPVKTVWEGIQILTGVNAGEPDENGNYPTDSVHHLVENKIKLFNKRLKLADSNKKKKKEKTELSESN